jgi:hypothetical protein
VHFYGKGISWGIQSWHFEAFRDAILVVVFCVWILQIDPKPFAELKNGSGGKEAGFNLRSNNKNKPL